MNVTSLGRNNIVCSEYIKGTTCHSRELCNTNCRVNSQLTNEMKVMNCILNLSNLIFLNENL